MEILRTILGYAEIKSIKFILIGGHAVNFYGISRQTGDIDLLISRTDKEEWVKLLNQLNYKILQDSDTFARFRPITMTAWPIDLMFTDPVSFEKIWDLSERDQDGIPIVSLKHLAILKLHALKTFQEERFAKDYTDLTAILRLKKDLFTETELHEVCLKYATSAIYDRLKQDGF